jgi:hypothetical protein
MPDPYTVRLLRAVVVNRFTSRFGLDDRDLPESLGDLQVRAKGHASRGVQADIVVPLIGYSLAAIAGVVGALGLVAVLIADRTGLNVSGWALLPAFIPLGTALPVFFSGGLIERGTAGGALRAHRIPWLLLVWAVPTGFVVTLMLAYFISVVR